MTNWEESTFWMLQQLTGGGEKQPKILFAHLEYETS